MNDRLSASWVLVVGSVFIAYWYYKTKPGPKASVDSDASRQSLGDGSPLERMKALARHFGVPIGSTTGGKHVPGSLHYQGRAMDVPLRGISEDLQREFTEAAINAGFQVHEEFKGSTPYSTGHHLHVSLPYPGGGW